MTDRHNIIPCRICGAAPEVVSVPRGYCVICPVCGDSDEVRISSTMAVVAWNRNRLS